MGQDGDPTTNRILPVHKELRVLKDLAQVLNKLKKVAFKILPGITSLHRKQDPAAEHKPEPMHTKAAHIKLLPLARPLCPEKH